MSASSPLILGDQDIEPAHVVEVTRGRSVILGEAARARMNASREVIDRVLERGDPVYGVTTGVGALKTVSVDREQQEAFNRALLLSHAVGHGDRAPAEFVRAAMVVRAAGLALGVAGVRPVVADAFCEALNTAVVPTVHLIGSIGQADLSQMAEIGLALTGQASDSYAEGGQVLEPLVLHPREAHAIVNSNAFSTGVACLALDAAERSVLALELAAALSYEAVRGNLDALHPEVARVRPYPGVAASSRRMRELMSGGALARREIAPRNLQDALCFKGLTQTQGAARDALSHLAAQLTTELRSSGDSPLVLLDEHRAISTGNHEIAPLAIALDYSRLGLAGAVTIANERIQKLLDPRFTGLPSGLRTNEYSAEDGLAIVGHGSTSLAAHARLLAQPVTLDQPTSSIAEGIEDRVTMAPLAALRLHELSGSATRLAAIEMLCAAQAIDLLGAAEELGRGTRAGYLTVRDHVTFGNLEADSNERLGRLADALPALIGREIDSAGLALTRAGQRPPMN